MPAALAIDPGRAKCGVAVVDDSDAVLYRAVVRTEALANVCAELLAQYRPVALLLGDGTGSSAVEEPLAALDPSLPLHRVDESHTSEQARRRYVNEKPAHGWRRLLPKALRTPETPYDDYVAILLAERWWRERQDTARARSPGGDSTQT